MMRSIHQRPGVLIFMAGFACMTSLAADPGSELTPWDRSAAALEKRRSQWASDPAPMAGATPEATARSLYGNQVFFNVRGAYLKPITDYLSAGLSRSLLRHFDECRDEVREWFARAEGGPKLGLSEGALFIGNYEGAQTFRIGKSEVQGDRATVTIHLSYEEGGYTYRWFDQAIFVRGAEGWVLDDIQFDPKKSPGGTLRKKTRMEK